MSNSEVVSTPDISDEFPDDVQAIEMDLRNFGAITHFSGEIVTVKCFEDNSLVKALVGEPGHGRVIVVDEIGAISLGVKALGSVPLKTEKLGHGQQGIPLRFGGASIRPGDWIYADNNGVLVASRKLL